MNIIISKEEFNLEKSVQLGQVFGWKHDDKTGIYYKALFNKLVTTRQNDDILEVSDERLIEYFDIRTSYNSIFKNLSLDEYTQSMIELGKGIHILKQDFFEATITFILSSCNNMQRINLIRNNLCKAYGHIVTDGVYSDYTFPTLEEFEEKGLERLSTLGFGYRLPYVIDAIQAFTKYPVELFTKLDDRMLYRALTSMNGIGPKVASCIMLFGAYRLNTFPIDRHIQRVIDAHYGGYYDMERYAPYNGIIQQYLFNGQTS